MLEINEDVDMSLKSRLRQLSILKKISIAMIVFAVVFASCYSLSMRHLNEITPPEGYVFPEVVPMLQGTYSCCGADERRPISYVGKQSISCATPKNAIGASSRGGDFSKSCWLKNELNNKDVIVRQRIVPVRCGFCWFSFGAINTPLVTQIASNGVIYFERDDQQLMEIWINDFRDVNIVGSFFMAIVLVGIFVFWLIQKD